MSSFTIQDLMKAIDMADGDVKGLFSPIDIHNANSNRDKSPINGMIAAAAQKAEQDGFYLHNVPIVRTSEVKEEARDLFLRLDTNFDERVDAVESANFNLSSNGQLLTR